jgi:hypothetical protein
MKKKRLGRGGDGSGAEQGAELALDDGGFAFSRGFW